MIVELATLDVPEILKYKIHGDIFWRLGLTAIAGTLIGMEREGHGRAAGLRTTLLVSLAACIAMIISDSFYVESFTSPQSDPTGWHPDPARLAAGVLAGMGFLGAGVIIHQGNHLTRGVTTAATLWLVSILGLAFGAGSYWVGIIGTLASLLILMIVPHLESRIRNDWYSDLGVTFSIGQCTVEEIVKALHPLKITVKGIDLNEDLETQRCHAVLHLRYKRGNPLTISEVVTSAVRKLKGVVRISFEG